MKRVIFSIILMFLFISCSGKTGPTGPQGPKGNSGTTIIYLIGVISSGQYHGSSIWINDSNIEEDAVVEVFVSPDKDTYAYQNIYDFELTHTRIYIADGSMQYLGYDYMVKIIQNSGL